MFIYYNKTLNGCLLQLKNKGKVQLGNPKSGCGRLRERWSYLELVAYESGRKESFNCIHDQIYRALYWGTNMATGT